MSNFLLGLFIGGLCVAYNKEIVVFIQNFIIKIKENKD